VGEVPPAPSGVAAAARRYGVALAFLAPAIAFLGIWVFYPTVWTVVRSFFDRGGDTFVWFDNYGELFTRDQTLTAIKNNAIWVAVVPALVTAIGLIFAVLTERVRWSVAFKTVVFMPMAISLFATGVIWRIMDQKEPDKGAVNAVIGAFADWVDPPGALTDAFAATPTLTGSPQQGYVLRRPVQPGQTALLPLTGILPDDVPAGAEQARAPEPRAGSVTGVVWRDFRPGGGTIGKVEPQEVGLPGVTIVLRDAEGSRVGSARADADGRFAFDDLEPGSYRVSIGNETFAKPFGGVSWLGAKLITPSIIVAYIWVWAGFALVVIAAGLAAIPRDVLEAARTDGASEWQVFRRVTAPLLAPVLSVVFITMVINVLKVFDIVMSVAPGSVQDDATVLALTMWRTAFGGVNDFGVGSAIAVFLFLLVIPVLALNVRRFRREQ
jgi:alpha-glucoside transport system permease protein